MPSLLTSANHNFPTSNFILVSVSMTIAPKFAAACRVPYMLLTSLVLEVTPQTLVFWTANGSELC